MSATTRRARAIATAVRGEGEPVTLPGGSVVTGYFELFDPRESAGNETGHAMRLSQQHNPTLALTDADAAALAEGDTLTIRGEDWRIARIDPDGNGLTTLSLATLQLRQLTEQIEGDAEALASQQHDPRAAETMRAIGDGVKFMTAQAQAMQQALERL